MKKRIFSILLCICMVCSLLPVTAGAAEEDMPTLTMGTDITLKKSGYYTYSEDGVNSTITKVGEENTCDFHYYLDNGTPTLHFYNDVEITLNHATNGSGSISINNDLAIYVANGKRVTINNSRDDASAAAKGACIYVSGDLTIAGEGTLEVTSTAYNANSIYALNELIIDDVTITANAGSKAIYAMLGITINGGSVTAIGDNGQNSTTQTTAGLSSYNDITINSGTVNATGRSAASDATTSCGIDGRNITITGGVVNATGEHSGNTSTSYGICSNSDNGSIAINGGTVTAKGNTQALTNRSPVSLHSLTSVSAGNTEGTATSVAQQTFLDNLADYQYAQFTRGHVVTLPSGVGYTVTPTVGSVLPVEEGGSYSFTVSIDDDYLQTGDFAVKANGTPLDAVGDTYTITDISGDQTVTVTGIEQRTYGLTLSEGGSWTATYGSEQPLTIQAAKSGNSPVVIQNITLSGANASAFTGAKAGGITYGSTEIDAAQDVYTITPKEALAVGEYQVTLNVTYYTDWNKTTTAIATKEYTFTVSQAAVTITPNVNQSKTYGTVDPTFTYTASPAVVAEDVLTRTEGETVGEYAYALKNNGNDNYALTLAQNAPKFSITKAAVDLSVALSPSSQKAGKDVTITVTAKNAGDNLMANGWTQPTGVSVTVGDTPVVMSQSDVVANGVWTGTYHIANDAALGNMTVTASVDDENGNYTDPANKAATLTVTEKGPVTVTLTASKITDVTYGDSVTYTANVSKHNSDDTDTLDGTVTFRLGDPNSGEVIGTSDNLTGATVTLDHTKLTAGNHTVYAVYSGNNFFATESANVTTVIGKATITVTAKDQSIYTGGTAPDLSAPALNTHYTVTGLAGGDTLGGTIAMEYQKDSTTATPDTASVGSYDIVISGATVPAGGNYNEAITFAKGTLTISTQPSSGGWYDYDYTPPSYKVEDVTPDKADGSIAFDHTNAPKGDDVTITVTPDRYYNVDGVIVKDKNGKEIPVTMNPDGTFSFEMPAGEVTVEPIFVWDNPFVDVDEETEYAEPVEWALKNGITTGATDTTFAPDGDCTRAQIVTFLWRAAGSPEPTGTAQSFADVDADDYFAKAVLWALENGITTGVTDTTFAPDAVCTRAQTVTFLHRAAGKPATEQGSAFDDVAADSYYAQAVAWAEANGITKGIGGSLFGSLDDCTRIQIVTFLYRFLGELTD